MQKLEGVIADSKNLSNFRIKEAMFRKKGSPRVAKSPYSTKSSLNYGKPFSSQASKRTPIESAGGFRNEKKSLPILETIERPKAAGQPYSVDRIVFSSTANKLLEEEDNNVAVSVDVESGPTEIELD